MDVEPKSRVFEWAPDDWGYKSEWIEWEGAGEGTSDACGDTCQVGLTS